MERLKTVISATLIALLSVTLLSPPAHATLGSTTERVRIQVDDGVELSALVITPTGTSGPHPLLVMPSAWATNKTLYVGAARRLAHESGYQVISYTSRGFNESGGEIEVAGPRDVADARAVIDWALATTEADPDRIGMAGISYGAGISLLTAAEDDRVRAVGAMSGWADLAASVYPNETFSTQAVELLLTSARLTGTPGDTLEAMEEGYRDGDARPALDAAPVRSAATGVDDINANGTAIMIAHAWNDGIFPPSQMTDFYGALRTPKRLMLAPGDHATQEAFGAFGLPNETWESLGRWFDHHLRGIDNGIDAEPPVQVRPNSGGGTWTGYPDWESVTASTTTYHLTRPAVTWTNWRSTGGLSTEVPGDWSYRIRTAFGTTANSGALLLSGAVQQFADIPTGVSLPLVNRVYAGVWTGPVLPGGATVSGTPRVRLTLTPNRADASLFVYLYAVDSSGTGSLLTHKPYTLRGAAPGEARTVEIALEPVVWRVPAGHRLALVVDGQDLRYGSENRAGGTVTVSSSADAPSWLRVPTA
ncbi:CocE/NonD family hydrolase [Thermobifida halotolerans]|uniref:CocE/NonD family hydrolase n=1 Tax=Thermobifida halotolerans TaxID=483545 RepID=A0A399G2F5_9ACTN|nr:CocE/NonD family hydrolase [Thermobifida halotolerans]UOE19837.1 CocE/NonD family hydrolase [Thermobifida halotolerans]